MSRRLAPDAAEHLAAVGVDLDALRDGIDPSAEEWHVALPARWERLADVPRDAAVRPVRTVRLLRGRDGVWRLDYTPVRALPPEERRAWTRPALVRLLRVVTGDDRHLEEPVAWLAARTGREVVRHAHGPVRDLMLRDGDGAVTSGAMALYCSTAEGLWLAWLGDRGWTMTESVFREREAVSPSGRAYRWRGWYLVATPDDVLVVACAREGYDAAAEMAEAERVLRRACGEDRREGDDGLALWGSGRRVT